MSRAILLCMFLSGSFCIGSIVNPVYAEELSLNRELMEYLAGEAVVNHGSDGILVQLPIDSDDGLSLGETLYARHCAVCHGDKLQGQPNWDVRDDNGLLPAPPHDESGHTWHHSDDQLFEVVKYGPPVAMGDASYLSAMPPFEGLLEDDEILSILIFIRSTWPEAQREWQNGANDAQTGKSWWRDTED